MRFLPPGSPADRVSAQSEPSPPRESRPGAAGSSLTPSDPLRQARRLPIRLLKMLTAHGGHLLHPEYLQPLTSAPLSIELDAKKSPLALLAQTCSQIGKSDPPPSSKLGSSCGQPDKEPAARPGVRPGELRPPPDDKSSFKPYSKAGAGGDVRREGGVTSGGGDKVGFRVPSGNGGNPTAAQPPYPPHAASPRADSGTPPGQAQQQQQRHKQNASPVGPPAPTEEAAHEQSSATSSNNNGKKDGEAAKASADAPHLANSSQVRASTNCSTGSSDGGGSNADGGGGGGSKAEPSAPSHVAPISPYKAGQPLFPLPPSSMGYHGGGGGYAGYPSQFVPALDKPGLGVGAMALGGKHPSSSPLTGASPPAFMQSLCRDPYCLSYPGVSHLGGGGGCGGGGGGGGGSCVHDPSSGLKSAFPLVYPSHPLHSLHQGALSSSVSSSLSHPLYTYGFMLPNEPPPPPPPHACNWVSAGGPCDKRFASSDELLAHLRTHTSLAVGVDSKLLSASSSGPASCHLHLPHQSSPGALPGSLAGSLALRAPPGLGLARYHPYSKVHLPSGPSPISLHSLPAAAPYYPHYALYSQRLGSASALGYQ